LRHHHHPLVKMMRRALSHRHHHPSRQVAHQKTVHLRHRHRHPLGDQMMMRTMIPSVEQVILRRYRVKQFKQAEIGAIKNTLE